MLNSRKSDADGGRKEQTHTLRQRLRAWWEGYDLPPAAPARAARAPDPGPEAPPPPPVHEWGIPRQELVQMLWGPGFSVPGEPEHVLELVKPFGLTSANTMLEIGAGLGGGARAVAGRIGCYVDAFEQSVDLVKHARELAISADIDKKAVFRPYDPATFEPKQRFYDAGLVRETLFAIPDKADFLDKVVASLKPNSSIVIADFFLPGPEPGAAAADALAAEGRPLFPCHAEAVLGLADGLGLELRINADETERYVAGVKAAWNIVAARLAQAPQDPHVSAAVLREIDIWTRRHLAFESGDLQFRRIVCFKKKSVV